MEKDCPTVQYHYSLLSESDGGYAAFVENDEDYSINPLFPMSRKGDYIAASRGNQYRIMFCSQNQYPVESIKLLRDGHHESDTELLLGEDDKKNFIRAGFLMRDSLNWGLYHCFYLPDYKILGNYELLQSQYIDRYMGLEKQNSLSGISLDEKKIRVSWRKYRDCLLHLLVDIDGQLYEIKTDKKSIDIYMQSGFSKKFGIEKDIFNILDQKTS